jgi:hypothetical protein
MRRGKLQLDCQKPPGFPWFYYRAIGNQEGKREIGFTQHVSSVFGRNGRSAANAAPRAHRMRKVART